MQKPWLSRVFYIVLGTLIITAGVVLTAVLVNINSSEVPGVLSPSPVPSDSSAGVSAAGDGDTGGAEDPDLASDSDTHKQAFDHIAHAVPGRAYTVYDLDGDGQDLVQLDGSRSHSHFFDAADAQLAVIVSWKWRSEDGTLLDESATPVVPFSLGTTRVWLDVEDSVGNKNTDSTNVTVLPSTRSGAYCYYYNTDGAAFDIPNNRVLPPKPIFGEEVSQISISDETDFPQQVRGGPVQMRCTYVVDTNGGETTFTVEHNGPMRMLAQRELSHDVIMETELPRLRNSTTDFVLTAGVEMIQIMYLWQGNEPATLRLIESPPTLHDLASQLPLIYELAPPNSTLDGGGIMKVFGTGLWSSPQVYFGGVVPIDPIFERSTDEFLAVEVPQSLTEGEIGVTVGNKVGGSNELTFRYSADSLCPIKFEQKELVDKEGETFGITLITNVKYGPDHRLYMTSLDSFVHSVTVSRDLKATDLCTSNSLGENRAVIGLAFNPADTELRLYASSSIIFWKNVGENLWSNGQVTEVRPNYNGLCLSTVGDPIITGLPVSNHDHGVNGLLFDDDGLLHLMVGGATNAGVPALTVGGIDESPLSGANLIADVTAEGFDGNVKYDSDDPGSSRQVSGDVEVYMAGWRNSFEMTLHSNGLMYATDNGANAEFGNRSTSCTTSDQISPYHSDDRIGKITKGRFGGHANRNRGRDDPIECVWRNPFENATNNFQPPIATTESSTDGIIEYTADLFGGQLKGDLMASKFSTNAEMNTGRVFRLQLNEEGNLKGDVDSLWEASGLSLVMSPWGDLLMPMLYENRVMALSPVYKSNKVGRLIAVSPFRGPKGGGNEVLVTGSRLGTGTVALFDGEPCTDVKESSDTSFKCTVPAGPGGTSVQVALRLGDGSVVESSGGYDYRYMRI